MMTFSTSFDDVDTTMRMSVSQNYWSQTPQSRATAPAASSGSSFQAAMPYVYTIVGFVGITTNLFVVVVIATSSTLKKRLENGLIFNQSLIDSLSGFFLVLTLTTSQTNIYLTGPFGEVICRIWMSSYPLWTTLQASIFGLMVMTVERYLEVVHPIFYKVNRSRRTVWIMILAPWVMAVLTSIQVVVFKNGVSSTGTCLPGTAWPSSQAMLANGIFTLCLKYGFPLPVFIYCYVRMFIALKKNNSLTVNSAGNAARKVETMTLMERARRNVIKTFLYVTIAHTLCYSLNQVLYAGSQVFNIYVDRNGILYVTSVAIIYLHCSVNPFIYILSYSAFRQDLTRRLRLQFSQKIQPSSAAVSGTASVGATSKLTETAM